MCVHGKASVFLVELPSERIRDNMTPQEAPPEALPAPDNAVVWSPVTGKWYDKAELITDGCLLIPNWISIFFFFRSLSGRARR